MADFKPRGAPNSQPKDPYAGWDLIHRNTMTPAGVYQKGDETSYGWAWPSMVTEPAQAIARLLDTPAGTMPDPQDPQNQKDALTGLMALYGGNALKGMAGARGAARVAATLGDMEAPRAVSYGNMIDDAFSNPALLRQMDDIKHAELNSQAKALYGRGIDELTGSQEAQLRGWSDPAFLSDTGKPNPLGAALASDRPSFTAYHGSPHDFDKFDMSKIGSGEGAQAYGHGLYFADSENVAKAYRDQLSPDHNQYFANLYKVNYGDGAAKAARQHGREDIATYIEAQARGDVKAPGHMYQVRINADPNAFLDWDKPLSQQSEAVRKTFSGLPISDNLHGPAKRTAEALKSGAYDDRMDGASLLAVLGGHRNAESATQSLREAGIPGIKYLDQGSRTAGEGSRNYVVFDDSLIEILKKYGLLAPGAAVGANALMPPDKNQ